MGKTIAQTIQWTKGTDLKVSPPSVKSYAVLSGVGLTVNGAKVATVSIPRGAAGAAFEAALIAGRSSIKVERVGRGRPSTATTAGGYAATLRSRTAATRAPRKPRTAAVAPDSATDSATA